MSYCSALGPHRFKSPCELIRLSNGGEPPSPCRAAAPSEGDSSYYLFGHSASQVRIPCELIRLSNGGEPPSPCRAAAPSEGDSSYYLFGHSASQVRIPCELIRLSNGGERGIRTPDRGLAYTRFPSVRLKPLGHLSSRNTHKFFRQHLAPQRE